MAWPVQVGFGRDPAAFTLAVYVDVGVVKWEV
jgi:hypothetical protein